MLGITDPGLHVLPGCNPLKELPHLVCLTALLGLHDQRQHI